MMHEINFCPTLKIPHDACNVKASLSFLVHINLKILKFTSGAFNRILSFFGRNSAQNLQNSSSASIFSSTSFLPSTAVMVSNVSIDYHPHALSKYKEGSVDYKLSLNSAVQISSPVKKEYSLKKAMIMTSINHSCATKQVFTARMQSLNTTYSKIKW